MFYNKPKYQIVRQSNPVWDAVLRCCDEVIRRGYIFVAGGIYVSGQRCCAIGALSICEESPTQTHRNGNRCYALAYQHLKNLGVTSSDLELIERGFENWAIGNRVARRGPTEQERSLWELGAYIRQNYNVVVGIEI